jgi:hypothetical protein
MSINFAFILVNIKFFLEEIMMDDDIQVGDNVRKEYEKQIEKFLDEFISIIYKGHDHIVARKYYRELFQQLIPKYFALQDEYQNKR